jgi:hypothetical protein
VSKLRPRVETAKAASGEAAFAFWWGWRELNSHALSGTRT